MTTITQALVKRYYFDAFRPGVSRFAVDSLVSKPEGPLSAAEGAR